MELNLIFLALNFSGYKYTAKFDLNSFMSHGSPHVAWGFDNL